MHINSVYQIIRELFFSKNIHTMRFGLAKGLKRKGGLTFLPLRKELSKEKKFISNAALIGKIVYDVGAMEGIFTLFFCKAVGEKGYVISFEPNPINYKILCKNVNLNGFKNIKIYNSALGIMNGMLFLSVLKWHRGSGTLLKNRDKSGRTISYFVAVKNLDILINSDNLPIPNFIKIDIEGFEIEVLNGMTKLLEKHKPELFIEVHDFIKDNMRNIILFLEKFSYSFYHVETNIFSTDKLKKIIKQGHLYCK